MSPVSAAHRADPPPPHLIICGCGPGELMAWVFPLLDALDQAGKGWRISLVLWPRLFPSGREAAVARESGRFDAVLEPCESRRLLWGARLPQELQGVAPRLILHLTGTPLFSRLLGKRLRCPVAAYAEKPLVAARGISRIFCADETTRAQMVRRCASQGGVVRVGNLMVDSVQGLLQQRRLRELDPERRHGSITVAILPGSRGIQLRNALGHVLPSVAAIQARLPQVHCLLVQSPFVAPEGFQRALDQARADGDVHLVQTSSSAAIERGDGLRVPIVGREEALLRADILITSPGTNTAEAAALGLPMIVVAPYGEDTQVFAGAAGVLERIPWFSGMVKRRVLAMLRGRMRYYALPNNRAGREIVPEITGPIDSAKIADTLAQLVEDGARRERMVRELAGLLGPPGAAALLVSELAACFAAAAEDDR